MRRDNVMKILNYKPPLLISLLIIIGFFVMFLLISNKKSYAIGVDSEEFKNSFTISIYSEIKSDYLQVKKMYDGDKQIFSIDINGDNGNEYIKEEKVNDHGLIYILSNTYPNVDIKDSNGNSLDSDFQTWITQTSIWLYLNERNIISLTDDEVLDIKRCNKLTSGSKTYSLKDDTIYNLYIKKIVDNALKIKKDENILNISLESDNIYSTIDNKYYQSSLITVSSNNSDNFKFYKINLENFPEGTIIVDEDGNKVDSDVYLSVTDKFYIRIPKKANVKDSNKFLIKVSGVFNSLEGYYYKSEGHTDMIETRKFDYEIEKSLNIKF